MQSKETNERDEASLSNLLDEEYLSFVHLSASKRPHSAKTPPGYKKITNKICYPHIYVYPSKRSIPKAYMSTSGNPNEGDLPHWIPPMREILRKRNSRHFQDSLISLKKVTVL